MKSEQTDLGNDPRLQQLRKAGFPVKVYPAKGQTWKNGHWRICDFIDYWPIKNTFFNKINKKSVRMSLDDFLVYWNKKIADKPTEQKFYGVKESLFSEFSKIPHASLRQSDCIDCYSFVVNGFHVRYGA